MSPEETREALLKRKSEIGLLCPALLDVLGDKPEIDHLFQKLYASGLDGVIPKYLKNASKQVLGQFFREVAKIDFERVQRHRSLLDDPAKLSLSSNQVDPVELVTLEEQANRCSEDVAAGQASLARGEWAGLAFAGGAGTRFFSSLGFLKDALRVPNEVISRRRMDMSMPKGAFPISPVLGLSFLEIFIAEALAASLRYRKLARVLLMTSSNTHDQTKRFLSGKSLWGYPKDGWFAFPQAEEPRLDAEKDLIVADEQGNLCWTGDGHGGVYRALVKKNVDNQSWLEKMHNLGVRHLVMHNVDNPAARPLDPQRIGFHLREDALFTMSAVRKIDPDEKVGLLMQHRETGRLEVVEYNELDHTIAGLRNPRTGRLLHEAGNINTHLVALEAVRPDIEPTIYRDKKVNSRIGEVSASSMEMLSQHITRLLDSGRVRAYEVDRSKFFMPTKNVSGSDSIESTTRMMARGFAEKLLDAGAIVDPEALCDLHPACGEQGEDLARSGLGVGWRLESGTRLYLCIHQEPQASNPVSEGNLHLEPDSTLILNADYPYGQVMMDGDYAVSADASTACNVHIGEGVVIAKGVRAVFRLSPGSRLKIPTRRVISKDMEIHLRPGESIEL